MITMKEGKTTHKALELSFLISKPESLVSKELNGEPAVHQDLF